MVCKCSTRWKGLSFAVLENNSFEIMQDCHSHGKISEFVSELKYLVHIVQVENEDKLDSKKAKGNVNVHHFSLPKGQWKVREFLTFGWVATRSCKILKCFYTQVVGKFNREQPDWWFSVKGNWFENLHTRWALSMLSLNGKNASELSETPFRVAIHSLLSAWGSITHYKFCHSDRNDNKEFPI